MPAEASSNELGCKYAGDPHGRPIRSVVSSRAGLPDEPQYSPSCTNQPLAGFWVDIVNDPGGEFTQSGYAVSRAMQVNGCVGASNWDEAVELGLVQNFPIGGGNADEKCKLIKGCPEPYPLVVCSLPGPIRSPTTSVVEPGASTFIITLTQIAHLTQP